MLCQKRYNLLKNFKFYSEKISIFDDKSFTANGMFELHNFLRYNFRPVWLQLFSSVVHCTTFSPNSLCIHSYKLTFVWISHKRWASDSRQTSAILSQTSSDSRYSNPTLPTGITCAEYNAP